MPQTLTFELVSPEKLLVSRPVAMVTIPGGEGDYGVLPDHAPMITTVRPGVIEIFADENAVATDRIFVAGGFAEVNQIRCTVLADEAVPVAELNRVALEEQARDIQARLSDHDANDRAALEVKQAIVAAKLVAAA